MNARDYLLLEYESLGDGDSVAGVLCPACEGGSTGERTLSVSRRDGTLLWICHRASCGFKGASGGAGAGTGLLREGNSRAAADERPAVRGAELPADAREVLGERYGITARHINRFGLGWTTAHSPSGRGRVYIPLRRGTEQHGYVARALDGEQRPKALTLYHSPEHPQGGWFPTLVARRGLAVVEDPFSAIRASDYLDAVALCGTIVSEGLAIELRRAKVGPIYLALDKDAYAQTIEQCIKYRSLVRMLPVQLPKDLKDMTHEELDVWMNENITGSN